MQWHQPFCLHRLGLCLKLFYFSLEEGEMLISNTENLSFQSFIFIAEETDKQQKVIFPGAQLNAVLDQKHGLMFNVWYTFSMLNLI